MTSLGMFETHHWSFFSTPGLILCYVALCVQEGKLKDLEINIFYRFVCMCVLKSGPTLSLSRLLQPNLKHIFASALLERKKTNGGRVRGREL